MKWQIVLEAELSAAPEDIEAALDHLMEHLIDEGAEDAGIGVSVTTGQTEIEFVIEAETLDDARQLAHKLVSKSLPLPGMGQMVGETTRRSLELLPV
jgi:hypothetical protein